MVTYDKYNAKDGLPNLSSLASTFYSLVQSTEGEKIVAMSENDTIPSLENLLNDKAAWLYFCPWYMNYLTSEQNNPVENLIEMYNSEYCITLDELPDLKSYPISDTPQSTTPTQPAATTPVVTTKPTDSNGLAGDANCDGIVDIADTVLLKCYLINSKNYSVTEQGLKNSDVQDKGNGINVQDVLMIQRQVLKITD